MKIDVFALCYNEELMLPFFINHYRKLGAQNITIYDNESTDNSVNIATKLGCTVFSYNSNNQIRDDIYLEMKNNCWKKSKADFVVVCDIDEFIEPPADLSKCTIVNTKGYDMIGLPPSRAGVPNIKYNKAVMFRPSEIYDINYGIGCHSARPIGNVYGSTEFANLLHYKYLSEEYVLNRHLLYKSRLSDINKKYEWGIEYQTAEKEKIDQQFAELRATAILVPNL